MVVPIEHCFSASPFRLQHAFVRNLHGHISTWFPSWHDQVIATRTSNPSRFGKGAWRGCAEEDVGVHSQGFLRISSALIRRIASSTSEYRCRKALGEYHLDTPDLARLLGYIPVVPPKRNRLEPWEYERLIYKCRNEVERLFRRLKGFRRVFVRYDKLDIIFLGFVTFALIVDTLHLC